MSKISLLRVAAGIAFPRACAGCRTPDASLLCDECAGSSLEAPERTLDPFRACIAAFTHDGAPREALLAAKLGGERRGLGQLAMRIPTLEAAGVPSADVVTNVPDTYRTRAQRGGSIAGALARHYARRIATPTATLLRKRVTTVDHGGASRAQRLADPQDAFAPIRDAPGRVVLVDDVVTTGATARACASALLAAGARELILVTFTSAVMRGEVSEDDTFAPVR